MPYKRNSDLPEGVKKALPHHAQDIYRAAFNNAYEHYGAAHEEVGHRVAWGAVKRHYVHVSAGVWVPRSNRT